MRPKLKRAANFLTFIPVTLFALILQSCSTTPAPSDPASVDVSEYEDMLTGTAFAIADADGDGVVTFEELKRVNPTSEKERFLINDHDSSGGLSPREFEVAIDRIGGFNTLISKIDADGDGVVSDAEGQRFREAIAGADQLSSFDELRRILD